MRQRTNLMKYKLSPKYHPFLNILVITKFLWQYIQGRNDTALVGGRFPRLKFKSRVEHPHDRINIHDQVWGHCLQSNLVYFTQWMYTYQDIWKELIRCSSWTPGHVTDDNIFMVRVNTFSCTDNYKSWNFSSCFTYYLCKNI